MIPNFLIRREMQKKKFLGAAEKIASNLFISRCVCEIPKLLTHQKRFYPIIFKGEGVASKIKLLVCHVTRRHIFPPHLLFFFYKIDIFLLNYLNIRIHNVNLFFHVSQILNVNNLNVDGYKIEREMARYWVY